MIKLNPLTIQWKNPEASLQIRQKWEKSPCPHPRAELDVTSRTVTCAMCGEQIDAFDFLLDLCVTENALLNKIQSLEYTKRQLEKQILKTKRNLLS